MLRALISRSIVSAPRTALLGLLAGASLATAPTAAFAGGHHGEFRVGFDIPGPIIVRHDAPPPCGPTETSIWVEPVYRTTCDPVWVPATYRTVCDRVWVEPAARTDCQRVWVPDRYEWRDVIRYEYGYRRICREQVLVERGHFENREVHVVVAAGHYEDVQRQELVCAGHWDNVERQELVTPGHWEPRPVYADRPVRYEDRPNLRIDLRIPIH